MSAPSSPTNSPPPSPTPHPSSPPIPPNPPQNLFDNGRRPLQGPPYWTRPRILAWIPPPGENWELKPAHELGLPPTQQTSTAQQNDDEHLQTSWYASTDPSTSSANPKNDEPWPRTPSPRTPPGTPPRQQQQQPLTTSRLPIAYRREFGNYAPSHAAEMPQRTHNPDRLHAPSRASNPSYTVAAKIESGLDASSASDNLRPRPTSTPSRASSPAPSSPLGSMHWPPMEGSLDGPSESKKSGQKGSLKYWKTQQTEEWVGEAISGTQPEEEHLQRHAQYLQNQNQNQNQDQSQGRSQGSTSSSSGYSTVAGSQAGSVGQMRAEAREGKQPEGDRKRSGGGWRYDGPDEEDKPEQKQGASDPKRDTTPQEFLKTYDALTNPGPESAYLHKALGQNAPQHAGESSKSSGAGAANPQEGSSSSQQPTSTSSQSQTQGSQQQRDTRSKDDSDGHEPGRYLSQWDGTDDDCDTSFDAFPDWAYSSKHTASQKQLMDDWDELVRRTHSCSQHGPVFWGSAEKSSNKSLRAKIPQLDGPGDDSKPDKSKGKGSSSGGSGSTGSSTTTDDDPRCD